MDDALLNKERKAIEFIRNAEKLALRMDERGFHVAFSGGKDSQVLLALVEKAGVKHHAEMQVTSVDPPELMKFVRKHYPQVHMNLPKKNMWQLIEQKGILPTRLARYCCEDLKEHAGAGSVTVVGIRAAESTRRAKRHDVEVIGVRDKGFRIEDDKLVANETISDGMFGMATDNEVRCVSGKDKVLISPIFDWTEDEVWAYLNDNVMPHCELYDKGWERIGCLLCPMAKKRERERERQEYPMVVERIYLRGIRLAMERGKFNMFDNEYDVFEWWLSGLSISDYKLKKQNKDDTSEKN